MSRFEKDMREGNILFHPVAQHQTRTNLRVISCCSNRNAWSCLICFPNEMTRKHTARKMDGCLNEPGFLHVLSPSSQKTQIDYLLYGNTKWFYIECFFLFFSHQSQNNVQCVCGCGGWSCVKEASLNLGLLWNVPLQDAAKKGRGCECLCVCLYVWLYVCVCLCVCMDAVVHLPPGMLI